MRKFLLFILLVLGIQSAYSQVFMDLKQENQRNVKRFMTGSEIEIKLKKDDFYVSGRINKIERDFMDVNGFKVIYSEIDYVLIRNQSLNFWATAFLYAGLGALILPPVNNLILNYRPLIAEEFAIGGAIFATSGFIMSRFVKKKYYFSEGYRLEVYIPEK